MGGIRLDRCRLPQQVRQNRPWQIGTFEFTRAGLLAYINKQFQCEFTGLDIITDFTYKPLGEEGHYHDGDNRRHGQHSCTR